jgi:hypothetical protein
VPLFNPAFLKWPGSRTLIGNVTQWLLSGNGGQAEIAAVAGEPAIYGVEVPWIVQDSLRRMGWQVTDQAAGAAGAVVYGVPTAEQAQAVAVLAKAGEPVVVANPEALEVAPLSGLVSRGATAGLSSSVARGGGSTLLDKPGTDRRLVVAPRFAVAARRGNW